MITHKHPMDRRMGEVILALTKSLINSTPCLPGVRMENRVCSSSPSVVFQSYLNIIKQFFPSPLRGEGQGGGDYFSCYYQMLSPSPQPPPLKGGGVLGAKRY